MGCGFNDATYATSYAPGLRREGQTVSVFGVYKDGRMSAEEWSELGPRFSTALGGALCESLHGDVLLANDRAAADAVDDNARADGVTDPLLDLFAPAAPADAILVFTVAGRLPTTRPPTIVDQPGLSSPRNPRGMGARGAGTAGGGISRVESGGRTTSSGSLDALDMSARLYSVREHHTVAVVALTYTGKSLDEAIAGFIVKLRAELPGMTCKAWNRDVRVDADRVRAARAPE
jgi:hypothetical protein